MNNDYTFEDAFSLISSIQQLLDAAQQRNDLAALIIALDDLKALHEHLAAMQQNAGGAS